MLVNSYGSDCKINYIVIWKRHLTKMDRLFVKKEQISPKKEMELTFNSYIISNNKFNLYSTA